MIELTDEQTIEMYDKIMLNHRLYGLKEDRDIYFIFDPSSKNFLPRETEVSDKHLYSFKIPYKDGEPWLEAEFSEYGKNWNSGRFYSIDHRFAEDAYLSYDYNFSLCRPIKPKDKHENLRKIFMDPDEDQLGKIRKAVEEDMKND